MTTIKTGDKVRTIGVPRNSPEYDDGIVVDLKGSGESQQAEVYWRRAETDYLEYVSTLEKIA